MRYLFFGSPDFAAIFLKNAIAAGLAPLAVVTNPDRPAGRKKIITPPPVKVLAKQHGIAVFQPATVAELKATALPEADLLVVAAYANIIPAAILQLPKKGVIGVHPSLLPKYRGATPIQSALLVGDSKTGVTLYQMDELVDHGPVIAQKEFLIAPAETYASLQQRLAELGASLFIETAEDYVAGRKELKEQEHDKATLTKKFKTADAEVDFKKDEPLAIYRKIQALNPEPGVYTLSFPGYEGRRVKLLAASFAEGKIRVRTIQVDGKKPLQLTS